MTTQVVNPYVVFTDREGNPIENGQIFIGAANQNPIAIPIQTYFDKDLSIAAPQPIRTIGGYPAQSGSPANIFVAPDDFSIVVLDKNGVLVFSSLSVTNITQLQSDISDTSDPAKGAALIGRGDQIVNSIAELRTLLKTSPSKFAFVTGYESANDGGGGHYRLDLSDIISADNGGTIIVADDGGRWKLIYSGFVKVEQFGCLAIAARNNFSQLSAATAFAYADNVELRAGSGTFEFDQTWDLSYPTLVVRGSGFRNTVFKFTGTGLAAGADGTRPNNGAFSFDLGLHDFTIEGTATTSTLLRVRINHADVSNINVREADPVAGVGFRIEGVVAGHFKQLTCSTNTQLMANRPLRGMIVDHDPTDSRRATDNVFEMTTIEGVLEDGIHLDKCDFGTFIGGTSENNPGVGISIASGCTGNTLNGMCFENAGFTDVFDDGKSTHLDNCYGTKGLHIGPNAVRHHTNGGFWNDVFENVAAQYSTIENIEYNFLISPTGNFVLNSSTWSARNIRNVQGAAWFVPKKPVVTIVVGASPFNFTNTTGMPVTVTVGGGTTVVVDLTRNGTVMPAGTGGAYYLPQGDSITIAYAVAPTMKRIIEGSNFS